MRALITLALILSACGQGAPETTGLGMNLKSEVPRLVTTCGEIFLIGAHNPKIVSTPSNAIVELHTGPISIGTSCSITVEEDGSISSPYKIFNPTCVVWCTAPQQVVKCKSIGTYMLLNHPVGHDLVNYKILENGDLEATTESCI